MPLRARASGDDTANGSEGFAPRRGTRSGRGYHRSMSSPRRRRPARAPAPRPRVRRRRPRRSRKLPIVIAGLAVVLAAAGVAAGAAVLAFGERCDLAALRPTQIGQNTFVYAADSSLLGVIPAERNRQVVPLGEDLALAQQGDGCDRGPPLLRARRNRRGGHRARALAGRQGGPRRRGRVDDQPAARPEPLHLERADGRAEDHGSVPRGEARRGLVEGQDPRDLSQLGLLRESRLRRRGRSQDVLLEAGALADPARRRRCSPGSTRRRPPTTRSSTPRARWPGATRCSGRCSTRG